MRKGSENVLPSQSWNDVSGAVHSHTSGVSRIAHKAHGPWPRVLLLFSCSVYFTCDMRAVRERIHVLESGLPPNPGFGRCPDRSLSLLAEFKTITITINAVILLLIIILPLFIIP